MSLGPIRVASLNLRAYPNHDRIEDLAQIIAAEEPHVVLLQEARSGWLETVCREAGLRGVHSHEVEPSLPDFPPDGCAIAVRPPVQLGKTWRLAPKVFEPPTVGAAIVEETPAGHEVLPPRLASRYSARTLLAELAVGGRKFVAGSFHATPGTGRVGGRKVHEWKPFFHGAVAIALGELTSPFVFAIDANEPLSETPDSTTFHWGEGRPGALKLGALLGLKPRHRGRDLLRESLARNGQAPMATDHLELTYTTRGGGKRRFDSMWATPEFDLLDMTVQYEKAVAAGTDHALTASDLNLTP